MDTRREPTLGDIILMPYVAHLDRLGLLAVWTAGRSHVVAWWALAREWPSFRRGFFDRITQAEFAERAKDT
jgi:hypothetical protein